MTSKILTLKAPLSSALQAKLHQQIKSIQPAKIKPDNKNLSSEAASQDSKKQRLIEAIEWLSAQYPQCFNRQEMKPLKIGIEKDLCVQGTWPHSKKFLRETLAFYVGSSWYQKALLEKTERVSLEGEILGHVTEEQKQAAQTQLDQLKEKRKAAYKLKKEQLKAKAEGYTKKKKLARLF